MAKTLKQGISIDFVYIMQCVNRRMRLQSLSTSKLGGGWVADFWNGYIEVRPADAMDYSLGEFVAVEVEGPKTAYTFIGMVTRLDDESAQLKLVSPVEERPLRGESRLCVDSLEGIMHSDEGSIAFICEDISESGVGILLPCNLPLGLNAHFTLATAFGGVDFIGSLKNCRPTSMIGHFRGGVQILHVDRISRARWRAMLEDRVETSRITSRAAA